MIRLRQKKITLTAAVLLLLIAGSPGKTHGAEFKATVVWTAHGNKQFWPLFVKGPKRRLERNLSGEKAVVITDLGAKRLVALYPKRRQFAVVQMDSPFAAPYDPFLFIDFFAHETFARRQTGLETVEGYSCDRYVYSSKDAGDWLTYDVAKKLDFPVRIEVLLNIPGIDPGWDSLEVTALQIGIVPDSLFQVPEGYTPLRHSLR